MKFVLPQSLLQGASSQKVSKNPKIYCIHSSLPKNAKSHFGFLGPLGVKCSVIEYPTLSLDRQAYLCCHPKSASNFNQFLEILPKLWWIYFRKLEITSNTQKLVALASIWNIAFIQKH
jgi:hypothetical protein